MLSDEHKKSFEAICQFKDWECQFSWQPLTDTEELFHCTWKHNANYIGSMAVRFTAPSTMYYHNLTLQESYQKQSLFTHLVVHITPWAAESGYTDTQFQMTGLGHKVFKLAGYPIDENGNISGNILNNEENRALHPETAAYYDWLTEQSPEEPEYRQRLKEEWAQNDQLRP